MFKPVSIRATLIACLIAYVGSFTLTSLYLLGEKRKTDKAWAQLKANLANPQITFDTTPE